MLFFANAILQASCAQVERFVIKTV